MCIFIYIHTYINSQIYSSVELMGEVAEDFRAIDVTNTAGIVFFFHSLVFVFPAFFVRSFFQPFWFFASFPFFLIFVLYFFVLLFLCSLLYALFSSLPSSLPSSAVFCKNLVRQVLDIHQHHPNNFTIQYLGGSLVIPLKLFGWCLS